MTTIVAHIVKKELIAQVSRTGPPGPPGAPGIGIPVGGTTGQVLAKSSNTNYDTEWADQSIDWGNVAGDIADQSDLQTLLTGKSNVGHGHVIADVTGLQAALDGKAALSHTHTASDITDFNAAADARITAQKGIANGLAMLDPDGKVPLSQLSSLTLTDVYVVDSEVEQLALVAEEGDVAIRTDESKSYVHNGGTAGTMADWSELLTPTDSVLSVNGYTGVVTLAKSDIGLANVTNDTQLKIASNLSDLNSVSTARTNLGLGTGDSPTFAGLTSPTVTSTSSELVLSQTGDTFGTTGMRFQNRDGANGAIFENISLNLVDFIFKPQTTTQQNIRFEGRTGVTNRYSTQNTTGEWQIGLPSLSGSHNATLFIGNGFTGIRQGAFGLLTNNATHTITLGSTGTGITLYNTSDQTTNYERMRLYQSSNIFNIRSEASGSGTVRKLTIGATGAVLTFDPAPGAASAFYTYNSSVTSVGVHSAQFFGTLQTSSGVNDQVLINPTINQGGTAGYNMLRINPTVVATGSGEKNLILAEVGGVDRFRVDSTGEVTVSGKITNVTDPTSNQDAATKKYVDDNVGLATPGGSDMELQYNNSGVLGGISNVGYNDSLKNLNFIMIGDSSQIIVEARNVAEDAWGSFTLSPNSGIALSSSSGIYGFDITDGAGQATLDFSGLTEGRSFTLPDSDGTLALVSDIPTMPGDIGAQPVDSDLTAIAALANTDGNFIVGNGSAWVVESGDTARTSLGLGTGDSPTFAGLTVDTNLTASSGIQTLASFAPTVTQTSSAGYTALLVNPTESSTGSGTKRLLDLQVGGASRFSVANTGAITNSSGSSTSTISSSAGGTKTLSVTGSSTGSGSYTVADFRGNTGGGHKTVVAIVNTNTNNGNNGSTLSLQAQSSTTTRQAFDIASIFSVKTDASRTSSVDFSVADAGSFTPALNFTGIATTLYGDLTLTGGKNVILDATTGSKIGTAATQKLGFWNATPVVQDTGWSVSNVTTDRSFDANATSIDELADTLGTLINTLKTYGLLGA